MHLEKYIEAATGEVKTSSTYATVQSSAIGSCLAVVVYDKKKGNGGIAHVMLPGKSPTYKSKLNTKYAEDAIDELLKQMKDLSSSPKNLKTFLVGAGNVLRKHDDVICTENIKSVNQILKARRLSVEKRALGGFERRRVKLDTRKGVVYYGEGGGGEKILWKKSKG